MGVSELVLGKSFGRLHTFHNLSLSKAHLLLTAPGELSLLGTDSNPPAEPAPWLAGEGVWEPASKGGAQVPEGTPRIRGS